MKMKSGVWRRFSKPLAVIARKQNKNEVLQIKMTSTYLQIEKGSGNKSTGRSGGREGGTREATFLSQLV